MTREITVCPECDSPQIRRRYPEKGGGRRLEDPHDYLCRDCGHGFDQPNTRDAKTKWSASKPSSGRARRLWEADPSTPDPTEAADE